MIWKKISQQIESFSYSLFIAFFFVPGIMTRSVAACAESVQSLSASDYVNIGLLPSYEGEKKARLGPPRISFLGNFNDIAASPRTVHMGGLQDHADVYFNLIGMEMGHSDNSGAILSVQDTDSSYYANRNGAGMTDGIVEFTKTNNNPPRLKAGDDITNSDGIHRMVTFTNTGFIVAPAFTDYQMAAIKGAGRIRVYSNWKSGNIISKVKHGLSHPNEYFSYVDPDTAVTENSGPISVTRFNVMTNDDSGQLGWRTEKQELPARQAPGKNPDDTIDNTEDSNTKYPGLIWKYRHPAVFIGMADHKFSHNDMIQLIPGNDSITREGTGAEYDLLAMQDHDWQYKISGITVNANGNGHRLTEDSTDMILGGEIPHHLQIWDGCDTMAVETSGFTLPGACRTKTPNSGSVMAQFNGRSYSGHRISLSVVNLVRNTPTHDWADNVPAIIASVDGDPRDPLAGGKIEGGLEFNADGEVGSVSLCAGEHAKNCALTVSKDGLVKAKKIVLPVGTPASSSSPCEQGETEIDARFLYTCVAHNVWHRMPNGSTW